MWISLRLLISCAARIQHLSAARSRISCVSFSRRTGFQSLSPGLHTDHRHRPGTSENTFLEFPLVIATVARFSRKRGLWLVVRVKKGDTRRYLHFYSFSSAASYVGMIQIRYTGLGDAANSQPDPSGSPVCLFSFF